MPEIRPFRALLLAVIVVILFTIGRFLAEGRDLRLIYIDQKPVLVNIADNPAERSRGLSYQPFLSDGHGMLFVFDKPEAACMWMKDMNFPLDVYWFSADGKLISYRHNISPDTFPSVHCPVQEATYMLELNVGEFSGIPRSITVPKQ